MRIPAVKFAAPAATPLPMAVLQAARGAFDPAGHAA
jgi:hypothetical protein